MMKLELPTPQSPGHFKRLRAWAAYQDSIKRTDLPELDKFESMLQWILQYVIEPADKSEAYNELLEASQEEIDGLFKALNPGDSTVPPVKGES
jgi:hypothetical protein